MPVEGINPNPFLDSLFKERPREREEFEAEGFITLKQKAEIDFIKEPLVWFGNIAMHTQTYKIQEGEKKLSIVERHVWDLLRYDIEDFWIEGEEGLWEILPKIMIMENDQGYTKLDTDTVAGLIILFRSKKQNLDPDLTRAA